MQNFGKIKKVLLIAACLFFSTLAVKAHNITANPDILFNNFESTAWCITVWASVNSSGQVVTTNFCCTVLMVDCGVTTSTSQSLPLPNGGLYPVNDLEDFVEYLAYIDNSIHSKDEVRTLTIINSGEFEESGVFYKIKSGTYTINKDIPGYSIDVQFETVKN